MIRVLIVDADQAIQAAFARFFEGTGAEVVAVESFEQVDAAMRAHADLIFADDFAAPPTPEQSEQLRARNFSTLAPIVCMTRVRISVEGARALGYAGVLAKPFKGAQVKETVARWLPMAA